MTRDEAFEQLIEAVERNATGQFQKVEDAFNIAAQALNYILEQIDGPSDKDAD